MIRLRARRYSREDTIILLAGLAVLLALPPLLVLTHGTIERQAHVTSGACFDFERWECRQDEGPDCATGISPFPPQYGWLPVVAGAAWLVTSTAILLNRGKWLHRHRHG